MFLFVQPFYVLPAGLPQPGDALLLPLAPIVLHGWDRRLSPGALRVLKSLAQFTAWVAIVDYAWVVLLGNWKVTGVDGMLLFPLYYVYNLILVFLALVLYRRFGDLFLRVTLLVVLGLVVLLVASSFVMPNASLRGALFFANPNQLGYHALLSGCIIALTQRRLGIGAVPTAIGLTGCAYLAILSASRSSVAGLAVLIVLVVFSNLRVIVLGSLAAVLALQVGGPLADGLAASEQRFRNHQLPHLSFFEQRGYDRIANNKQYLVFGAGEGGYTRFAETTAIGAGEIHSSAAMLLFSYGVVGVAMFCLFLWNLIRRSRLRVALMLVPPLLYTFAHQGLRFSMLWVLVAVFISVKGSPEAGEFRRTQARPRGPHLDRSPLSEAT